MEKKWEDLTPEEKAELFRILDTYPYDYEAYNLAGLVRYFAFLLLVVAIGLPLTKPKKKTNEEST